LPAREARKLFIEARVHTRVEIFGILIGTRLNWLHQFHRDIGVIECIESKFKLPFAAKRKLVLRGRQHSAVDPVEPHDAWRCTRFNPILAGRNPLRMPIFSRQHWNQSLQEAVASVQEVLCIHTDVEWHAALRKK
jgi:hypothetical protein